MTHKVAEFADRIARIMPLVMKEFGQRISGSLRASDISLQQLFILDFMHLYEESTMTQLARYMKVSTAAMTGTIEKLVREGYCLRIYDPQDRRIIKIKLTARGSELIKRINDQRRKIIVEIFSQIPEIDRKNYLRILTRIKEILSQDK